MNIEVSTFNVILSVLLSVGISTQIWILSELVRLKISVARLKEHLGMRDDDTQRLLRKKRS